MHHRRPRCNYRWSIGNITLNQTCYFGLCSSFLLMLLPLSSMEDRICVTTRYTENGGAKYLDLLATAQRRGSEQSRDAGSCPCLQVLQAWRELVQGVASCCPCFHLGGDVFCVQHDSTMRQHLHQLRLHRCTDFCLKAQTNIKHWLEHSYDVRKTQVIQGRNNNPPLSQGRRKALYGTPESYIKELSHSRLKCSPPLIPCIHVLTAPLLKMNFILKIQSPPHQIP